MIRVRPKQARAPLGCGGVSLIFLLVFVWLGQFGKHPAGAVGALVFLLACLAVALWYSRKRAAARRAVLVASFGERAADLILEGMVWQGATQAMVQEVLGGPIDVATKVRKQRTEETWKYRRRGRNRYGLRITFENGVCIGWEDS